MFVSKLLNKLFFNTNNDCYFITLLNLNQFMLTMDYHKAILDRSISDDFSQKNEEKISCDSLNEEKISCDSLNEEKISCDSLNEEKISCDSLNEEKISCDSLNEEKISCDSLNEDKLSQDSLNEDKLSCDSLNDEVLLKRKHEWTTTNDPIFINEVDDLQKKNIIRCISPIPFPLSEQNTPENKFRPIVEKEPILSEFSGAYSPKQTDTLFWCIFIIVNGYGEYININRNYGVKELEIKQKIGHFVANMEYKKNDTNYRITNTLRQEIYSELLTSQKETNFSCLVILCCYYRINLVLLHSNGKLMLEFISSRDEETPYYVLNKDTYDKYSVNTDKKTWKDVQEMKTRLVCINHYMKPMKASGNYKMEDLEELADKMGILDMTKKYKKAELYHLVSESINWFK